MNREIESILKEHNVLKTGHFLLSSGLHSGKYFEKFRILENPELVQMFGQMIAEHFAGKNISVVCGPTTGGVIIAYEVARQMGLKCIFAEAKPGASGRVIGRGFTIPERAKILVVDDILTTGGSIKETIDALRSLVPRRSFPGTITRIGYPSSRIGFSETRIGYPSSCIGFSVIGISVLIDRSAEPIKWSELVSGVDFYACYKIAVENFEPNNCSLCKGNIPLETPGRGSKK